jgi:hypothetical protein
LFVSPFRVLENRSKQKGRSNFKATLFPDGDCSEMRAMPCLQLFLHCF